METVNGRQSVYDMICSSSESGKVDRRGLSYRSSKHESSVLVYSREECEVRAVDDDCTLENTDVAADEVVDPYEAVDALEFARERRAIGDSERSEIRVDGRLQGHLRDAS